MVPEKVGFEKIGVGVSLCAMDVEDVANAEEPSLVVRVTNAMTSVINLQREIFVDIPHQMS